MRALDESPGLLHEVLLKWRGTRAGPGNFLVKPVAGASSLMRQMRETRSAL
jgi:hypothetical protein